VTDYRTPFPEEVFSDVALRRKLRTEFAAGDVEAAEGILSYLDDHMADFTTPNRRGEAVNYGKLCAIRLSAGDLTRLSSVVKRYPDIRDLSQMAETSLEAAKDRESIRTCSPMSPGDRDEVRQRDRDLLAAWVAAEEPVDDSEFRMAVDWLWER